MARQTIDGRFAIRNISWKTPVRVATTASITIATALNNGDTLDGVTLATGDRVLVKDQATGSQNGIYVVGASPARAADYLLPGDALGSLVIVSEGSANADTAWLCTTNAPIVVGTSTLAFAAFGTGGGSSLTVAELDGTPTVINVTEILVTNGTLTDNGGGSVTITITGGGGSDFTTDGSMYRFPSGASIDTIAQEDVGDGTDATILLTDGFMELRAIDGVGGQSRLELDGYGSGITLTAFSALITLAADTGIVLSLGAGLVQMVGGDGVRVPELSSAPASPIENQTYYDTTAHVMYTWDGSTWQPHW